MHEKTTCNPGGYSDYRHRLIFKLTLKLEKSFSRRITLLTRLFFRRHTAIPYILKWLFISGILGICIGTASAGFLQSLDWVTAYRETHLWLIALLPFGGLLIGMLYTHYGKDVEAGNNLLIDTINNPGGTVPLKMAPFVYVGTMVTHLLGGSAGREGTALQMAGAIADQFSIPLRLSENDRKVLIIAAIAAGFGSVFGTPLAGAIFGLEVFLIGRITYAALFPVIMSATLADLVTNLWKTHHTHYHIDLVPAISLPTLLYALGAGLVFGLCAASFSRLIHTVSALFKAKISYPPLRPFIGGILVALGVWTIGTTNYIGLGIPTILASFEKQLPAYDFALKMAFTLITLAAGFKGGEVTPLFFIGATLGNALSYFVPLPTELLAGMGFVAVFAGATNTPLACTIMAMELFGSGCGVYVAVACVTSYLVSGHYSIYGRQLIGEPKHSRFSQYMGKRLNEL
ncbi:voltage-gated chloride channel family protein [Fibrella aquatica]|uniref:voltage-gated chloride channel family protein n=1 Tax=Fibrella aquatica TaxID=3242487 RepID=UPI0035219E0A